MSITSLNGRERVRMALARKEPDRVPYDQSSRSSAIEEEAYADLCRYLGGGNGDVTCFLRAHAEYDEPVRSILGIDTEFIRYFSDEHWRSGSDGKTFIDAWDVTWKKKPGNLYYELDDCPLAHLDYAEILGQEWPPLVTAELSSRLKAQVEKAENRSERALFSDQIGAGLFERAWYMRGLERFMMDLVLDEEGVRGYLQKILDHQIEGYRVLLDAIGSHIQGILLTEDLASQESLLISPELYRKVLFPFHKKLLDYLTSRGTRVIFHSCGAVAPLIPDLLDAGMEILHPVQRSAAGMSLSELSRDFSGEFCIWGAGCDTALLQSGTPVEIQDDVKRTLDHLAPGGGLVYTTSHCIQAGTPPENILAMAQALNGQSYRSGEFYQCLKDTTEITQ